MQPHDRSLPSAPNFSARQRVGSEPVKVLACVARDDEGNFLVRELRRRNAEVTVIWPLPEILPCDADVVYCEYRRDLSRRVPWVPGDPKAAFVIVLPRAEPIEDEVIVHVAPDAVLARPFTASAIAASFVLARGQFAYINRLRGKADKLEENLRAMRTVERAKSILVTTRNIDNDEAYNFIRRQAMDRRISVTNVAAAIVASHDMLSPRNRN